MIARIAKSIAKLGVLSVLLLAVPNVAAQQNSSQVQALEPREAIGGILMAGLVGGILGLSTLSFYTRPQDNIRNISIGAGVGMIAAAIYMTYSVTETAKPAGRSAIFPSGEAQAHWAIMPDFNPSTGRASASYVLNF